MGLLVIQESGLISQSFSCWFLFSYLKALATVLFNANHVYLVLTPHLIPASILSVFSYSVQCFMLSGWGRIAGRMGRLVVKYLLINILCL